MTPQEPSTDQEAKTEPVPATPSIEAEPTTSRMDSAPTSQPVSAISGQSKVKSGKKKAVIWTIVIVLLVALIGGGVLAYNLWYQNPNKVISDGLFNAVRHKGSSAGTATIMVENEQLKADVAVNAKTDGKLVNGDAKLHLTLKSSNLNVKSETFDTSVEFAGDKANIYVKPKGIRPLMEKYLDYSMAAYTQSLNSAGQMQGVSPDQKQIDQQKRLMIQQVEPVIKKLENSWISLTPNVAASNEEGACVMKVFEKFSQDDLMKNELIDVYRDNSFVTVKEKLGSKDGSLGYKVNLNETVAKEFGKAAEQTTFAKEVKKCNKNATNTSSSSDETTDSTNENVEVELWVSRWSHQITKLVVNGDEDGTKVSTTVNMNYDKVDGLSVPKDAIKPEDLLKELGAQGASPAGAVSPLAI